MCDAPERIVIDHSRSNIWWTEEEAHWGPLDMTTYIRADLTADWFITMQYVWTFLLERLGHTKFPMEEGSADAVLDDFKAAISTVEWQARIEALQEAAEVSKKWRLAAYRNEQPDPSFKEVEYEILSLIRRKKNEV